MKLLLISNKVPPLLDGVGDYSYNLGRALKKRGHEVVLLSGAFERQELDGDEVKVLPAVESWDAQGARKILPIILALGCRYVIFNYVPHGFDARGIPYRLRDFLSELAKVCEGLSIFFHEPFIRLRFVPPHHFIYGALQRLIARNLCRIATDLITSIDLYKRMLSTVTSKDVALIPVGSNIGEHSFTDSQLREVRTSLGATGKRLLVTFGSRDNQLLVETFNRLKNQGWVLCICGEIRDIRHIDTTAENLVLTGRLSPRELSLYIAAADIFFAADGVDGSGRGGTSNKSGSLAAALSIGIPIVGVIGDMNNELLKKAENVLLVEADPQKLAQKIQELSVDMPARNVEFFQRYLDWVVIAEQYEKLIDSKSLQA